MPRTTASYKMAEYHGNLRHPIRKALGSPNQRTQLRPAGPRWIASWLPKAQLQASARAQMYVHVAMAEGAFVREHVPRQSARR